MRDPAGFTTHYTYDAIGNLHTVQLPSGGKITQNFDARSRLRTVRDPLGYQIAFDYNTEDQFTMITTFRGMMTAPLESLQAVSADRAIFPGSLGFQSYLLQMSSIDKPPYSLRGFTVDQSNRNRYSSWTQRHRRPCRSKADYKRKWRRSKTSWVNSNCRPITTPKKV